MCYFVRNDFFAIIWKNVVAASLFIVFLAVNIGVNHSVVWERFV